MARDGGDLSDDRYGERGKARSYGTVPGRLSQSEAQTQPGSEEDEPFKIPTAFELARGAYRFITGHPVIRDRLLNIVVGLLAIFGLVYWLEPEYLHYVFFQKIYVNMPECVFLVLLVYATLKMTAKVFLQSGKPKLAIAVFCVGALATYFSYVFSDGFVYVNLYNEKVFAEISKPMESSKTAVRLTPYQTAEKIFEDRFTESAYTPGDLDPVIQDGVFTYVAPRAPDGFVNIMWSSSPGLVVYRDLEQTEVESIDQEFLVGEAMEITDDLDRVLVTMDFWSEYPEIYYARLTDKKWYAVCPRIKYRPSFPCVFTPYWAGVVLVSSAGDPEELTAEQALKDSRLTGIRIYPEKLARMYVEAEEYNYGGGSYVLGPLGILFRRKDHIEVPEIGDGNEMPFLMGTEKGQFWITAVEPHGKSFGLMRLYYQDATTGKGFFYTRPKGKSWLGPNRARNKVKGVPGYNWLETSGDSEGGSYRVVEPRFLTCRGRVYWMFSIVTKAYDTVVATVCVDAATGSVGETTFRSNRAFFKWFRPKWIPKADRIGEAEILLQRVMKLLQAEKRARKEMK